MPSDVDPEGKAFDGLGEVVKSLYVTVGRHEMLRDQTVLLTEAMRRRNSLSVDVWLTVHDLEGHDFMLLEGMSKMFGEASEAMRK